MSGNDQQTAGSEYTGPDKPGSGALAQPDRFPIEAHIGFKNTQCRHSCSIWFITNERNHNSRFRGFSRSAARSPYKPGIEPINRKGGKNESKTVKKPQSVECYVPEGFKLLTLVTNSQPHTQSDSRMTRRLYIAGNRLLTHILFWVGYLFVYTGVHAEGEDGLWAYFLIELQGLPAAMLVTYFNIYFLFPRFFKPKRYIAYALGSIALLFVASLLNRVLIERIIEPRFFPDTTYYEPIFVWYLLFKVMLWFLAPVLLFTLLIKAVGHWVEQERIHQDTMREKLAAELNLLKGQVHPHFLFNTLNNLYALTLRGAPTAPQVVLKLSELMSYMLYESQSEHILLEKEIGHISNYIALERLRYGNRLDVSLIASGETEGKMIAPLLLIPFVENAFKHGVSDETENVWVTIDIKVKDGWLGVKVENSHAAGERRDSQNAATGGIGLQNVRRRLALLYPDTHKLTLTKEPEYYSVDLKIRL